MPIELQDIPKAVRDYVMTKITESVTISSAVGPQINPGEEFNIRISATNPSGGVALKNVIMQVQVADEHYAILIVPPPPIVSTVTLFGPLLPTGTLVKGLYLPRFTTTPWQPGQTENFVLKGRALKTPGTQVKFSIDHAEIDLDSLFPKPSQGYVITQDVTVVS